MRLAPVAILLAACGPKSPPRVVIQEQPADEVAQVAGQWVTSDDRDWGYTMTIEPAGDTERREGTIDVWIDRGKMGRCEQKGTIERGTASRTFRVVYRRGECNPAAVNVPIEMTIASFTGATLTVVVSGERRTYQRAPE